MRVLILGASGMVGMGVLLECLDDIRIDAVTVLGRSPCGVSHRKLTEVLHRDFNDFSAIAPHLAGIDACYFCLGVSAAGMTEERYHHLTYDLTLAVARALLAESPGAVFIYVSGSGTDSSEKGRMMWARVKGRTENALLAMPFTKAYMFRPGFIEPMRGVRSKTRLYQTMITISRPLFPVIRAVAPRLVTTSVAMGQAMIRVTIDGSEKRIFETSDINAVASGR